MTQGKKKNPWKPSAFEAKLPAGVHKQSVPLLNHDTVGGITLVMNSVRKYKTATTARY